MSARRFIHRLITGQGSHVTSLFVLVCVALPMFTAACKAMAKDDGRVRAQPRVAHAQVAAKDILPSSGGQHTAGSGDLLLRSDFEDASVVPPAKKSQKQMDVLKLKLPSGAPADIGIFYEGGQPSARFARVVPDPADPNNQVLQFWIKEARVPGQREGKSKGRIQMAMANLNFTEVSQRYRMYLHPDLKLYRSYPDDNTWFTINELWFGAKWKGDSHPFRITLGIAKEKGANQPLYFLATGETGAGGRPKHGKWSAVWHSLNKNFQIPVGEWMDMEMGYRQGNASTGRFYLAVKRQSDPRMITVIDVHDWTYHPEAPEPVPLTSWNPLKIYTSGAIIDYIRTQGGVAQIYFDDLEIRKAWRR